VCPGSDYPGGSCPDTVGDGRWSAGTRRRSLASSGRAVPRWARFHRYSAVGAVVLSVGHFPLDTSPS